MIPETQHFGSRLRAERERLGISLESIAIQTKIKKTYLIGLENGDFSRWPAGEVFRRAYVRDYANALGIKAAPIVADYVRLFPNGEADARPVASTAKGARSVAQRPAAPLAMTFDRDLTWYAKLTGKRMLAAAVDLGTLLAISALLALARGSSFWGTAGVLALVYFPATTAWFGRSLTSWYLETRSSQRHGGSTRMRPAASREPLTSGDADHVHPPVHVVHEPSHEPDALMDSVLLISGDSEPANAAREAPIH